MCVTSFTGTKVQILTRGAASQLSSRDGIVCVTCFTSTKVQTLTPEMEAGEFARRDDEIQNVIDPQRLKRALIDP